MTPEQIDEAAGQAGFRLLPLVDDPTADQVKTAAAAVAELMRRLATPQASNAVTTPADVAAVLVSLHGAAQWLAHLTDALGQYCDKLATAPALTAVDPFSVRAPEEAAREAARYLCVEAAEPLARATRYIGRAQRDVAALRLGGEVA